MAGRDRLGDRACFLALLTFLLLSPPVLTLFGTGGRVFDIPVLVVYCFAVWLVAILAGRRISVSLDATEYSGRARRDEPISPGDG
jgi:hypothetical protein